MKPLVQDLLNHNVSRTHVDALGWGLGEASEPQAAETAWASNFLPVLGCSNPVSLCLPQDCYILDQRGTKIYVWKGRGATKVEKQAAMAKALVGGADVQTLSGSLNQ